MSKSRVIIATAAEQPWRYLIVDEARILDCGELSPASPPQLPRLKTILVIPGTGVSTHWMEPSGKTPAQTRAAAALLLQQEIAVPRERVHVSLGPPQQDGLLAACVIDRALMEAILADASKRGISPDVVIPDHLMLPRPVGDDVIGVRLGDTVAVRGRELAFTAEPDLAATIIGNRPQLIFERESDIEPRLTESAAHPAINLLQDEFAAGRNGALTWTQFRRAAVLAGVAAFSPFILLAAQIVRDERGASDLEARATAAARAVDDTSTGDPILHLKSKLADLHAGEKFLSATAILFDAVARTKGAELESLSYLQDGVMRATLIHDAPSDVAAFAQIVEKAGIALQQDPSAQKGTRIATAMTLRPR